MASVSEAHHSTSSLAATARGHDFLLHLHRDLESAPTVNRSDGAMAATSMQGMVTEAMKLIRTASPPTWESAVTNNVLIFVLGSPLLVTGLSASGIAAAFLLGTLTSS
ncbi:hypothetical protein Rs2_47819 [Raphanus sativus]|nr:hypothetical protein Rs2_47819 [Raphanus sativus]